MISLILLIVLGYIGYCIFNKLKLPSPVILGPFCLTAMVQLTGHCNLTLPQWLPLFLTIGVAISVTQNFELKLQGSLLDFIATLLFTLILGLVAYRCLLAYGMEGQTAYFSALPGGGIDLALIAMNYPSADPFRVILYQTFRFFAVVIIYPIVLRQLIKQKETGGFLAQKMTGPIYHSENLQNPVLSCNNQQEKPLSVHTNMILLAITFILGILIAYLFNCIQFPGGNYLGGMLATICMCYICNKTLQIKPNMDRKIAQFFKIATCSMLGLKINHDSVLALWNEWPILIIQNIIIIAGCLILGWIFYRLGRGDLMTCLLETAAGGVLPMSVMAEELGGDVIRVSIFQVLRILFIVILAPLILTYIIPLIS